MDQDGYIHTPPMERMPYETFINLMCHRCEKMFPPDRTFHCSDCGLLVCGECSEWVELGSPEEDIPTGKTRAIQAGKIRICKLCINEGE